MKDALTKKILELREMYSEVYKSKDTLSPAKFDEITDKVRIEIEKFAKSHNIGIDIRLIAASPEQYEEYVTSGLVKEFIHRNDGVM